MKLLKKITLFSLLLLSYTIHAQIAYYPFDGNANDVISGFNGTVNGATLAPDRDGNPNSAYLFDGVDDFIEVMNSAAFNFGTGEFAVSLWIKPLNPTQAFQMVFIKGGLNGGSDPHYWLRLNDAIGNTSMRALWGNGSPNPEIIDYNNPGLLYDGEWHHIVFQRTSERDELYIDCMLIGTNDENTIDVTGIGNLLLGAQHPNPPTSTNVYNFYNGLIDDVAFYDSSLDMAGVEEFCATPPPPPSEDVPTLGEWSLIILALLMMITGIAGIRQRNTKEAYS